MSAVPFTNQGPPSVPADLRKAIWDMIGLSEDFDIAAQQAARLNDLKTQNFDLATAASTGTSQGTGRVLALKVPWGRADIVTGYGICVATAGGTLTADQNLMWLCDYTGALIANSASVDQATAWTGTGPLQAAVAAGPLTVAANPGGFLYVCVLAVGTTIPLFRIQNGVTSVPNGFAARKRFGLDAATGVTAPQGLTVATMANREPTWVGLY